MENFPGYSSGKSIVYKSFYFARTDSHSFIIKIKQIEIEIYKREVNLDLPKAL